MRRRTLKYIWDIADACEAIEEFTRDKTLDDYRADRMLRDAVERELTIIGEALFQAEKTQPDLANHITDLKKVVAFRHILVHGYGEI